MPKRLYHRLVRAGRRRVVPPELQTWLTINNFAPIMTGTSIMVGGAERFSSPSFFVANAIAPWWVWGVTFLLTGAWSAYANWKGARRPMLCGQWTAALLYFFFGITAFGSVLHNPMASATGVSVYVWVAISHLGAAVALRGRVNDDA